MRNNLARSRFGGPAPRIGERHPPGAVLDSAVRRAGSRDRAERRLQAVRRGDGGPHRGPDDPTAPHRRECGRLSTRLRTLESRGGIRAVPGDAGRRSGGRDLAARRRQGQSDRPDDGAGQGGGASARRQGDRTHPRARCAHGGWPSVRCAHRCRGGHRSRNRGELRRAVGQGHRGRWPGG